MTSQHYLRNPSTGALVPIGTEERGLYIAAKRGARPAADQAWRAQQLVAFTSGLSQFALDGSSAFAGSPNTLPSPLAKQVMA